MTDNQPPENREIRTPTCDNIPDSIACAEAAGMRPDAYAYSATVTTYTGGTRKAADAITEIAVTAGAAVSLWFEDAPPVSGLRAVTVSAVGRWVAVRAFLTALDRSTGKDI